MNFEKALEHTLEFEGGYANDPVDRGGETFRGISRKNWPGWPGWKRIDQIKDAGHTTAKKINAYFAKDQDMLQMVSDFYYDNFWKPFMPLMMTGRIMEKTFDTAVNMGIGRVVKFIQISLNRMLPGDPLAVDGRLGQKTRAGMGKAMDLPEAESQFLQHFAKEQEGFYRRLASRNPSQKRFLKGWLRRAVWLPE